MKSVEELLRIKTRPLTKVAPDVTVYEAVRLMAEYDVGALIVCDRDGNKLVGMITERDYARKIVLQGRSSRNTLVRDIMSEKVVFVTPTQDVEDCMILMTQKRVRHLPVVGDGKVLGLLSMGDLVHATISEKEYIIHQLEHYIHG